MRAFLDETGNTERQAAMGTVNPAVIPRNHLVEEAIDAAAETGDFSEFEALLSVLASPYEDQPKYSTYTQPPRNDQIVRQTFCGT